jgi:hypothetical protein
MKCGAWVCALCLIALVQGFASGITPGWDGLYDGRRLRNPAKPYWEASITNGLDAFDVEWAKGATGNVAYADGKLVIEKTNDAGYGVVSMRRGLTMPVKTKLRSFVDAEISDADGDYSLALPRILDGNNRLHSCWGLDAIGVFMGGGQKTAYLVNTPPGVAERRFSHHVVSETGGTNLTPAIVIAGAPAKMKVVRWGIEDYDRAHDAWVRERAKCYPKRDHKTDLEEESAFAQRIAADVEHTAKVVRKDGGVRLLVDGALELPFIYKNAHCWNRNWGDYNGRAMSRNGIRLQTINVGGADHWNGAVWDREQALKDIRDQMRCSPDALYIMTFDATTPRAYAEANPTEWMRHPDGTPIGGNWGSGYGSYSYTEEKREMPTNCWPWISVSSKKYRADMQAILAGLVEDLKREELSKRIIGLHTSGWHDGQFAQYRPDFSECARQGFREYLKAKGIATPEDFKLPVPGKESWFGGEKADLQHQFNVYLHIAPFRCQEELVQTAKRCFGKDIVAMHWCMGLWGGQMNCAHYLEEFCASDVMDALVAQPSYVRRLPGNSVGVAAPVESFSKHGKLYIDELDLRAYGLIAGYVKEPSAMGLGHATDFPMWQTINRRMVGRLFARGHGLWYYDISGGFYDPPEIAADIGAAARTGRELLAAAAADPGWRPSAALVVDEKGMLWRNSIGNARCADIAGVIGGQTELLASSSVPYETWTAADAMGDPSLLTNAKVVALGGFFKLDAAREKFISGLLDAGKTVLVLSGFADDSWKKLGISAQARGMGRQPEIVPEGANDPQDFRSIYHCEWMRWSLGVTGGDIANLNRPTSFSFEDDFGGAVTLARYAQDKLPAVVRKGNLIAFGQAASLTPHFFNRLVREAGGYVPVEDGLEVDMNGGFLSVHALKTGHFDFQLPFPCTVMNLKTGLPAPVRDGRLSLDLAAGTTCWFRLAK